MRKARDPSHTSVRFGGRVRLEKSTLSTTWRRGLPIRWAGTPSRHPIARVGAATALAAVAEVRVPVFLVEVRIENIEGGLAGMVLANPEMRSA